MTKDQLKQRLLTEFFNTEVTIPNIEGLSDADIQEIRNIASSSGNSMKNILATKLADIITQQVEDLVNDKIQQLATLNTNLIIPTRNS